MNAHVKKKREDSISFLNPAPQLKRPLSFYNPVDYLRILYWAFFFPQAFRWYINKWENSHNGSNTPNNPPKTLNRSSLQRRLGIQAMITLFTTVPAGSLVLAGFGLTPSWEIMAASLIIATVFGGLMGKYFGIAFGVTSGVTFGLMCSLLGTFLGLGDIPGFGPNFGLNLGITLGASFGTAAASVSSIKSGVDPKILKGVCGGIIFVIAGSLFLAIIPLISSTTKGITAEILSSNIQIIGFFSIGIGAAFSVSLSRLPEFFFYTTGSLFARFHTVSKHCSLHARVVFLRIPGLQKRLVCELEKDWQTGIHHVNRLLAYTMQFFPVINAVNKVLERSSAGTLPAKAAALANRPFDWNLIKFCSADIKKHLRKQAAIGLLLFLPYRIKKRITLEPIELRTDTPARAACAGFWYWYRQKPDEAVQAFLHIRHLHHGQELYQIARAISQGLQAAGDVKKNKNRIEGIADWELQTHWLEEWEGPELRTGTLRVLRELRKIAGNIRAASNAWSPLQRSQIIKRTRHNLTRIIKTTDNTYPQPEWSLIKKIAREWLQLISGSKWEITDEVLGRPVENPYEGYSGRPVTGPTFTGRTNVMEQIEERWAYSNSFKPLVVYGHRRMGKTSVLKKLEQNTDSNMLLVYISMQDIGIADHTGQFFLELAEAIYNAAKKNELPADSPPEEKDYSSANSGRRAFNTILDNLDVMMTGKKCLVLAIDEFEIIEQNIKAQRLDEMLLHVLRSAIQKYRWLGLIFAGLHTLDEIWRDYRSPFYGQAELIRLSYFDRNDTARLITYPQPGFSLEYTHELVDQLYSLTYGQPYLIQCICWELTNQWLKRHNQLDQKTSRILTVDDLIPILTSEFFKSAEYYFDGVWSNISDDEKILLRIISGKKEGSWTIDELVSHLSREKSPHEASPLFSKLETTLSLLTRHDVILKKNGNVCFASELMRRWVAAKS